MATDIDIPKFIENMKRVERECRSYATATYEASKGAKYDVEAAVHLGVQYGIATGKADAYGQVRDILQEFLDRQ